MATEFEDFFSVNANEPCVRFTIYGEPASKENSRRLVQRGNRTIPIKSEKALSYVKRQFDIPMMRPLLDGDLAVVIRIYYASRRSDLDESLILDMMQGRVYENDRQVREKHIYWEIDEPDPRADIEVYRRPDRD